MTFTKYQKIAGVGLLAILLSLSVVVGNISAIADEPTANEATVTLDVQGMT